MIKWFNTRNNILKFLICISLAFICLFLTKQILKNYYSFEVFSHNNTYEKRDIIDETEYYNINVKYPKFNNSKINKIISDYIFNYIKEFKKGIKDNSGSINTLEINYNISFIDNFLNIFFKINNSIDKNNNTKNILINLKNYKISSIIELYDEELLINKIYSAVVKKYPAFISNKIVQTNVKIFNYDINNDLITVFFNKSMFDKELTYIPYITISLVEEVYFEEYNINNTKKMVALTFDDGPSEYTFQIVDILKLNNARGTFFMLGNRMKYQSSIVQAVYLSGNEIGSHSYSHKNLTRISKKELLTEINSVTILYNEITGDTLKYLRPPYGSIDSRLVETSAFSLIKWSIDPVDWLSRDAEKISSHILEKVYDGAIILLHDLYPETIEALKIVIPELQAGGYELVTISELAEYHEYTLSQGKIIREMP